MSHYLRTDKGVKFEFSDAMGPDQPNAGHLTLSTDDEGRVVLDVTTANGQGAGLYLSERASIALIAKLADLLNG